MSSAKLKAKGRTRSLHQPPRKRKAKGRTNSLHQTPRKQLKKLQDTVAEVVKSLIHIAESLDKVDKYFSTSMEALRYSKSEYMERDVLEVMHDGWEKLLDTTTYLDRTIDVLDPDGAEARLNKRCEA